MRIVGWPGKSDADGAILPVSIVDVDFHGTPEELRAIGEFMLMAADELDQARASNSLLNVGIELENDDSSPEVGGWVNVVRHAAE